MYKLITGLILGILIATHGGSAQALSGQQISPNNAWSWWTDPKVVTVGDDTYFTGLQAGGNWRVFQENDGTTTPVSLYATTEDDDHNAPSIVAESGKDTISFFTRHGESAFVNYMVAPDGTLNFGAKQKLTFSGNVTYSQPLTYEDTIVLLTRVGNCTWSYMVSTDWGATWGEEQALLDVCASESRAYLSATKIEGEDGKYHLGMYGYPGDDIEDIWYGQLDLDTGDVTTYSSTVGNIYTPTALPLDNTNFDLVWTPIGNDGQKVRLLDVGNKQGTNLVFYALWTNSVTIPEYYMSKQNPTTGAWTKVKLFVSSGGWIGVGSSYDARKYVGGIALSKNGDNYVYMARKDNSTWKVERYSIDSSLDVTFSSTRDTSTLPLVRVVTPQDGVGVSYLQAQTYNGFTDFLTYTYWRK